MLEKMRESGMLGENRGKSEPWDQRVLQSSGKSEGSFFIGGNRVKSDSQIRLIGYKEDSSLE